MLFSRCVHFSKNSIARKSQVKKKRNNPQRERRALRQEKAKATTPVARPRGGISFVRFRVVPSAFGDGRGTLQWIWKRVRTVVEQVFGKGLRSTNKTALTTVRSERPNPLCELAAYPAQQVPVAAGEGTPTPRDACEGITAEERDTFLRIVEASWLIKRHHDFHLWLQGEIQHFIRHEVLISAHGYFDTWQLKLDIISSLPGVRTHLLAHCSIDDILKALFERWVNNERRPFVLDSLQELAPGDVECQCPLHTVLRNTKSVLVHGVRNERGNCGSLYVALHSASVTQGCMSGCFSRAPCFVLDSLITQIDIASRTLASLPSGKTTPTAFRDGGPFSLSEREREILEWVCKGKTNFETGMILDISSFTVKNHIKRIFQKIGANNRVQAVTIYKEQIANAENGWRR